MFPLQVKVAVCEPDIVVGLSAQLRPPGLEAEDRPTGPMNPFVQLKLMVNVVETPGVNEPSAGP